MDPLQNPNKALQEQGFQAPAAQQSVSPAPQINTPTTPQAITNSGNPNAAWQNNVQAPQAPVTVNVGTQALQEQPKPQTNAPGTSLAMPASGSVVDLLNNAGQDSSFAAREQLAQKYGIQGYQGTASQNQELAKKYLEAFDTVKNSPAPQTGAEGRASVQEALTQSQQQPEQDPIKKFMDTYASMNPIEANIFQQLSTLASTPTNQQSLTDFYKQEVAKQGIPELNVQLANINKIMDGTEDDIRAEITNAGGFATESQVQALAGARNKTLLKQANYLSDVINAKNDYVDRIVSLTQADRKQVSDDIDRKLGITKTLADMADRMQSNAKENYQAIVDSVGWGGLANSLKGNPEQIQKVESLFGLAPGELQALGQYKKPLTDMEQVQLENAKLQNQKLRQDLSTGPSVSTQVVDVNGKKVLINSKTGQVISDISANFKPEQGVQLAQAQQTIVDTDSLLKSPGLNSAVGTSFLTRGSYGPLSIVDTLSGAKSNFIAGVEQLRQQLTLDKLTQAKSNGATFGALSDSEQQLLAASATKLGSWAIKDKAGNVTGYQTDEKDFKQELDKINNFSKMDFILKGGSPEAVGVQQMQDGTLWTKNSDGTFTKLQ